MSVARRPPPAYGPIGELPWNMVRRSVKEFFDWAVQDYSGIPGGFKNTVATVIRAGISALAGTLDAGWAAADHVHSVLTGVAVDIGTANAEGNSEALSRADHVHKLGFPILAPDGSVSAPSYSFLGAPTMGLYRLLSLLRLKGSDGVGTDASGGDGTTATIIQGGQGTGTGHGGGVRIQVMPPGVASGSGVNTYRNSLFASASNGAVSIGAVPVPAPGPSNLQGANTLSGVSNVAGGAQDVSGGQGTGSGAGGTVKVRHAPAGSSGSAQNVLTDAESWVPGSTVDPQLRLASLGDGNGGTMVRQAFSENLVLNTVGTTTDTAANLLPANAIILAVTTRVTTAISGGGVTAFSVGDPTTAARFSASAGGLGAGSTRVGLQHQQGGIATDAAGPVQAAAAQVRITTDAAPSAGAVRVTVWALVFTAPTS